jgi:hypothetical protein
MNKLEQKEIELIQSYLTQEEAKIIIPEYKENFDLAFRKENNLYNHEAQKYVNPAHYLNDAFDWTKTSQGHDYWYRIYALLTQRYHDGV